MTCLAGLRRSLAGVRLIAVQEIDRRTAVNQLCPLAMRTITSRQNDAVRAFRALAARADPTGVQLLLDGAHLVGDAHRAGLRLENAAVASSHLAADTEEGRLARLLEGEGVPVIEVSDHVLRAVSPVRTPSGIVAIARRDPCGIEQIAGDRHAFVLVVAGVQDPGNLGSLLRAAEAGGVTGAIVCVNTANPFSWKALRGSMGSALRVPIATGTTPEGALAALRAAGIRTVAAVARFGRDPDAVRWSERVGLVVGAEGAGLAADLAERCDEQVTIPMGPHVESLNVAVAGAILIYAARRQRSPPMDNLVR